MHRMTIHEIIELLKLFLTVATTTTTRFHGEKSDGKPTVLHAVGHAAFESARMAVQKDLHQVLRAHPAQDKQVTFSVHYSDLNGLSKLENYILGHEITAYLGEGQNHQGNFCLLLILDKTLSTSYITLHPPPSSTTPRGLAAGQSRSVPSPHAISLP